MAVNVTINGRREEAEAGSTLASILEEKRVRPEVCAVYLNRVRVDRDALSATVAEDGDKVEILIQFAGGSDA
ncbi:MAG: sulfur carrier protein ThiS [Coriobacteriia bacterium]